MIKKENKKYKKIAPPFGYFGSKNKIAFELCQHLPPHNYWVEAFCGSSAVTLAKPPAPIEIINDVDGEIVNLFRQLRNNSKMLCKQIELTPYAEDELLVARNENEDETSDLERARQFLVKSMMAINGAFGDSKGGFSYSDSYSRNNKEARVNRWNNLPERLDKVVGRLKDVRIENKEAKKLIERFIDRPATLIYLDPPYLAERLHGYEIEANDYNFHFDLLNLICTSRAMIFISGYKNELYSELLTEDKGWSLKEIEATTKGSNGSVKKRTEVIWMNSHFTNALNSGIIPIELDENETINKKLNPKR